MVVLSARGGQTPVTSLALISHCKQTMRGDCIHFESKFATKSFCQAELFFEKVYLKITRGVSRQTNADQQLEKAVLSGRRKMLFCFPVRSARNNAIRWNDVFAVRSPNTVGAHVWASYGLTFLSGSCCSRRQRDGWKCARRVHSGDFPLRFPIWHCEIGNCEQPPLLESFFWDVLRRA